MKNIVVIGAGYAGVLTAKKLAKKLKKEEVSISIIDKNSYHTMLTELHEVAANRVDEDSIRMSLKQIFAGQKVDVVLDTVKEVHFDTKTVEGESGKYKYDYLVLAAGSKPTFFGVPGAEEFSYTLWSYDDAVNLKIRIEDRFRKASCETNLKKKKELLSFFIVGAGFTGVEMAGELGEYIPFLCEKFEIPKEMVKIVDVDGLPRPVPILPEKLSVKVEKRLKKMGVDVVMNTSVVGVGENYIELKQGDKVRREIAGTVIWTAGIESADVTNKAATQLKSQGRGRINVDSYLRSVDHEDVYVVGDNMMYIPEGEKTPVPQMVENCEQSAHTAAHNIVSSITGKKEMENYKPAFHGVMVCVGGRYGAAHVGLPKFMFSLPSFLAMFAKHFINVIYFIQVLGWNKIFSYVKHEFFTIRNCRSFLGGHFSNRTPSFLLVPLRVFLGVVWLFEGIMKIVEGWFDAPKLTGFFGGAAAWYQSVLYGASADTAAAATGATDAAAAATGVADAAASASGVVAEGASYGMALFNYKILGLFDMIFVTGKTVETSTLSDYAFKLDIPLMNWFVDNVILSGDGIQVFMQVMIVLMEIAIGLALMGGLLTTPAAFVSLVLQFMFVCTTGLYVSTFWMAFAGIALLIGGGRTLGLDYYFMPWLKKQWKKVPFVRRWYIYND